MTLAWVCSHTAGEAGSSPRRQGGRQTAVSGRDCVTQCGSVAAFISSQPAPIESLDIWHG